MIKAEPKMFSLRKGAKIFPNILILLFWSVFFSDLSAQTVPRLEKADMAGIEKITTTLYSSDGLWGYINGGADLYLEYGFKELSSQRITVGGASFVADIYRMNSPEAAFGIFSILRFKCLETLLLTENDCLTPWQYLGVKGPYLLSVVNTTGTENDRLINLQIASIMLSEMSADNAPIPEVFTKAELQAGLPRLKYVKGSLGLQNGYPSWGSFFDGFADYNAWIMPVERNNNTGVLARIEFFDSNECQRFSNNNMFEWYDQNGATGSSKPSILKMQSKWLWLVQGGISNEVQKLVEP